MKWAVLFVLIFGLAGCDSGPAVRQNLAQCELDPHAHDAVGAFDDSFLLTCMQARGFALDHNQAGPCKTILYPAMQATCYRPDDWLHNLIPLK